VVGEVVAEEEAGGVAEGVEDGGEVEVGGLGLGQDRHGVIVARGWRVAGCRMVRQFGIVEMIKEAP
jgi:hypothetical protein